MRPVKVLSVLFLCTTACVISCKTKSAKELIVSKWKLKELTGGTTAQIPDSIKAKMTSTATMEFTADNKYILTGVQATPSNGTYSVSDDGKILTIIDNETKKPEVDSINELSGSKLVITDVFGNKLACIK